MKETESGGMTRQDYRKDPHHVDAYFLFLRVLELEVEEEQHQRAIGLLRMWKYHCENGDRDRLAMMIGLTDGFLKELE